ncbi:imidazole glycerol phosphate synthase subunit HisH [Chitinimonas arctica]|uniref:Imidazole glycerol phosphate synthase subunit HisH n=1 Tax=Chitinimonas arctica TaxID=2594795 RepID=A0A516SC36_9NEIS|nr:imidazole glycerol phosphate synthase subunit HisH [Chitinimonas arctica]QDQ25719.1 imidazole glycerol phosphate synthase subunit HisH [Chitinimonas arctica]
MCSKITLLDYGMGNLLNVARAFEHCGADVTITEDASLALAAERLVVPGVGAFRDCISELASRGFDEVIHRFVATERPFLGICVGMQMLFEGSEEFGEHRGLGILEGRVRGIPSRNTQNIQQRVPQIGWNYLIPAEGCEHWRGGVLEGLEAKRAAVYFVHSYAAVPSDPSIRLADTLYGGHRLCAAVQQANVMATQFHPERSGKVGLSILRSFIQI